MIATRESVAPGTARADLDDRRARTGAALHQLRMCVDVVRAAAWHSPSSNCVHGRGTFFSKCREWSIGDEAGYWTCVGERRLVVSPVPSCPLALSHQDHSRGGQQPPRTSRPDTRSFMSTEGKPMRPARGALMRRVDEKPNYQGSDRKPKHCYNDGSKVQRLSGRPDRIDLLTHERV
jgi:hypothetical protein